MATQRQKVIRNDGGMQVVEVLSGGSSVAWGDISGKPTTFAPPAATASVVGGVKQGAAVADAAAAPTQAEYNALLASLRTAGIISTS
ncbi:head fiber protein [Serratia proteamaculans]|uniref:head fiber protein n=1 Tax=Serratia proteamaculans TaxID=28151 RepID=UPI00217B0572|nr:head fiber protein [Serratia proteamaculans]CAI1023839.1 Head fiber protein [Serratia proteamaculans]CAI1034016.1 Head fiber protein [Serratia proteamaculans]